jgi:tRNA A37 threonylcarbamoyladenosine dehydratase
MTIPPQFQRVQLLVGEKACDRLAATRVVIFGVGGVGSWCAEALIRSGITDLTIVDSDQICVTNINRQVQATAATVGCVKVTALARRLLEINPAAHITALQKIYDRTTCAEFDLSSYDYIIDAIDSLSAKVELIANAFTAGTKLFCALGASAKLDPARIRIASIWESHGCHLGRLVRKRLRRRKAEGDCLCIYSDEVLPGFQADLACGSGQCLCPKTVRAEDGGASVHEWCSHKKQINGSAVHMSATYGFMLAGLVMQDVVNRSSAVEMTSGG